MSITPKQRQAFIESLPYVKRLELYVQCDGYRPMSMKARRDPVMKEWYRCKQHAYWKFTALKNSRYSKSGIYCMSHLFVNGIGCGEDEEARLNKYWDKFKVKHDIQT